MKKNYSMRIASMLLVLVLLTTCVISGTFAKYVTEGEAEDTARVAKWGVTVTVTGDEAFGLKYDDAIETSGTKVVSNETGEVKKVLAPGTNGTLGSVAITGTPEVYVTVKAGLAVTLKGWEVAVEDKDNDGNLDTEYYCPLEITVGSTTLKGTDYDSAAEFEEAIEALVVYKISAEDANSSLEGYQVNANVDLAYSVSLKWAWAYEGNDDVKDTALGNLGTAPTIKAEWNASVTQVD